MARTLRPIALIVLTSTLLALLVLIIGPENAVDQLVAMQTTIRAHQVESAVVLFIWSTILFLTVLPLGTATILIAGALLGTWAGWVQFVAQLVASLIIYEAAPPSREQDAIQYLDARPRLKTAILRLQHHGIVATSFLRILPVVPSALCSILCKALDIHRSKFIAGTVAVGWIRPVLFASIGSAASLAAIKGHISFL